MPEVISVPLLAWKLFSELRSLVLMHIQALVSRATSLEWNPEAVILCYLCGFANNVKLMFVPLCSFSPNKQERKVAYSHIMQTVALLLLTHKVLKVSYEETIVRLSDGLQERRKWLLLETYCALIQLRIHFENLSSAATSVITRVTHSEIVFSGIADINASAMCPTESS